MSPRPEVPQFGALLRSHIAGVPPEGRPAYLAGLERSAATRYREWAEAVPDLSAELLACAAREDEIADLISGSFPVSADVQAAIDASLPAAIALYYEVFDRHAISDQLFLQSEAELQGAQAWVAMATDTDDASTREVLERCALLERQSSAAVTRLVDTLAAQG